MQRKEAQGPGVGTGRRKMLSTLGHTLCLLRTGIVGEGTLLNTLGNCSTLAVEFLEPPASGYRLQASPGPSHLEKMVVGVGNHCYSGRKAI